jgi:hypothetical protein
VSWHAAPSEVLQAGWIVELDGRPYRVEYVNFSRAYCLPLGKDDGEESKNERGKNISPTAMVKILSKEVDMAKRVCEICKDEKNPLHSDNKGTTHRACRKLKTAAPAAEPHADDIDSGAVESSDVVEAPEATVVLVETTITEPVPATEPITKEEKKVAKKQAKKSEPGEGRKVQSYQTAAKAPKDDQFREGSQIALVYQAVEKIGTATAAEVTAFVAKKAQTKGNLAANVAFYLSKLKGAGFVKVAR